MTAIARLWRCTRATMAALAISIATAAAIMAGLLAASLWAPQNQPAIRAHLAAAVADGTINTYAPFGAFSSLRLPYYTLDCLLFGMMLAPSTGTLSDAIGNRRPWTDWPEMDPRVPPFHDCQGLLGALPELGSAGSPRTGFYQYDRYILGMKTLGRVMLSFMGVVTMKRVLLIGVYGLLAVVLGLALRRFTAAGADAAARARAAGFLAIGLCFAVFYALAQSGGML